jgi:hypothetical protein
LHIVGVVVVVDVVVVVVVDNDIRALVYVMRAAPMSCFVNAASS